MSIKRFRKKPVEVEAVQWTGNNDDELWQFVGWENITWFGLVPGIETLEGNMMVSKGDWVIKGVQGECYPCKPDIFDETYEAV